MEDKEKSNLKKYIIDGMAFIFLIWLTFFILLRNQDTNEILNILKTAKFHYVFLGFFCMVIYFLCESLNLKRNLNALKEKASLVSCAKYSIIGFFFSSITPAATGGQPMQIYFMHKDGIKVAHSSLSLVMNLFAFQVVTIGSALISIVFFRTYMNWQLIILFIIGITINSWALFLLTAGLFSKRLSTWIVKIAVKVMKKLKVHKIEEKEKSLEEALKNYHMSAKFIRNNRNLLFKQFITTTMQELMFYSVPFFVYKAFGFNAKSYIEIVALQAIVYATVSGMPFPGAVGVSEGAFVEIFRPIFGEKLIKSAMLLNRGIGFYIYIIISAIVLFATIILNTRKKKEINIVLEHNTKTIE